MDVEVAINCLWAEVARYNENSRVREAWQTLKTAVLAQQTTNKQSTPCKVNAMCPNYDRCLSCRVNSFECI
jgi:hypothetical protein